MISKQVSKMINYTKTSQALVIKKVYVKLCRSRIQTFQIMRTGKQDKQDGYIRGTLLNH